MRILLWSLQIVVLTAGLHLFLRFVRTTRGNPLIRGLFVSVLVGVLGLWSLSTALDLEELRYILEGSTGFIVVGLAIVFQSELRRGIAQLGSSFGGRLGRNRRAEAVPEVVKAAIAMSARREGGLIAFERQSSLHTTIETGSALHATASSRLIESLFHPGGALHDGAVIIREERIVAAGCFLPLPEKTQLDASLGTRHHAALGLSEESDAVVLVVSEESGAISIARGGNLHLDIPPEELEEQLRVLLQTEGPDQQTARRRMPPFATIRRDVGWLLGSALLACGILYVAHQNIRETRPFRVQIVDGGTVARRTPIEGEILVLPPGETVRLKDPAPDTRFRLAITGSRSQFDELGGSIRGTLEIDDPDWDGGVLNLEDVRWEDSVIGLAYRWDGRAPEMRVERFDTRRIQLQPSDVVVDDLLLDPAFEARSQDVVFEPGSNITIGGPHTRMELLGTEISLAPIVLSAEDRGEVRERVRLAPSLIEQGFTLSDRTPVEIVVPIVPVQRTAGSVTKELALICLAPDRVEELARWNLPANAHTARFTVETSGLLPHDADPGSPAMLERKTAILRFVEENLRVFVDVAELPPRGEGRSVPIRWYWRKDWRDSPDSFGLDPETLGEWEDLSVQLEGEPRILLEPRDRPPDAESP